MRDRAVVLGDAPAHLRRRASSISGAVRRHRRLEIGVLGAQIGEHVGVVDGRIGGVAQPVIRVLDASRRGASKLCGRCSATGGGGSWPAGVVGEGVWAVMVSFRVWAAAGRLARSRAAVSRRMRKGIRSGARLALGEGRTGLYLAGLNRLGNAQYPRGVTLPPPHFPTPPHPCHNRSMPDPRVAAIRSIRRERGRAIATGSGFFCPMEAEPLNLPPQRGAQRNGATVAKRRERPADGSPKRTRSSSRHNGAVAPLPPRAKPSAKASISCLHGQCEHSEHSSPSRHHRLGDPASRF